MPRPDSTSLIRAPSAAAPFQDPRFSCPPYIAPTSTAMLILTKISHVQLLDFQKIDGIKYYVVNIYEKSTRRRNAGSSANMKHLRRLSDFSSATESAVAVESSSAVAVKRKPAYRVVKRFRDFEELRKQLRRCFEGSKKSGGCSCCDAFTTFLSCRSMQPGLLVKLTKREAERKNVLEQFINQVIRLAVMESHHHDQTTSCRVKDQVPAILEQFVHATTQQKTKKLTHADDFAMTA